MNSQQKMVKWCGIILAIVNIPLFIDWEWIAETEELNLQIGASEILIGWAVIGLATWLAIRALKDKPDTAPEP
jgi:hypothetical protein